MRAVDELSRHVVEALADAMAPRILRRAGDCVLDCVGAAAAGRGAESVAAIETLANSTFASGRCGLWFTGKTASAGAAGLVNAMAATALDVDDVHRKAAGHPGVSVITAALATAEDIGASGSDLLTAIVVGYDVSVRAALARVPVHHDSTVSGRWSGIGAAAAAARLRGLNTGHAAEALLIAEQHAPRLAPALHHGFAGSHVKEGIAWATMAGLCAVDLASAGFKGYPNAFDDGVLYDPAVLTATLGEDFAIDGLLFKPYACCRWAHPAIDALAEIIGTNTLRPSDIDRVEVRTFERAAGLGNAPAPRIAEEAQFSIPFLLAVMACEGPDAFLPLDDGLLGRPDLEAFAGRVSIDIDPALDRLFPAQTAARIRVHCGARVFEAEEEYPLGDPQNPMDREALQHKFRVLTRTALSGDRGEAIIDACAVLENEPGLGRFFELLGGEPGRLS